MLSTIKGGGNAPYFCDKKNYIIFAIPFFTLVLLGMWLHWAASLFLVAVPPLAGGLKPN